MSEKQSVILIAEDDGDIRRMIATYLGRTTDCEILEARNGEEALELMRMSGPSVLVLDLMMPKISGWEVLEARRADETLRKIPVIVVSANRGVELTSAIDDDVVALLPKPVDLRALSSLVKATMAE